MNYGGRRPGFGHSDRNNSSSERPGFGSSDRPSFNSSDRPAFGQKTSFNQNPVQSKQPTRVSSYMDQMRQEEQAGRGGMGYRGGYGKSKYGNFSSGGREGKRSYNDYRHNKKDEHTKIQIYK